MQTEKSELETLVSTMREEKSEAMAEIEAKGAALESVTTLQYMLTTVPSK